MIQHQAIATEAAPSAIGPYSQAIRWGSMIFCSGQVPVDPRSGELVAGSIADQTEQVVANVKAVLEAAGSSLRQVVKTTVFLTSMEQFAAMNEVYARHFPEPFPARSTVAVAGLPRGAMVEIETVAYLES